MAQLSKLTSREAVDRALDEYDQLGRAAFLAKHGFGRARDYFIDHAGRYYDSKAITGVAYGLQHPAEGTLTSDDFSGGKHTVEIALRRLGFKVVPDPYKYLVLAENEIHARAEFEKWEDVTGERYHFPNIYRNKISPGREFVYYKGARRVGGRATPEYFGWGRIGSVYADPATVDSAASHRHWLCDIEDYRPFANAVPFRDAAGKYIELGADRAPQRYWENGVREITERDFHGILTRAGIQLSLPKDDIADVTSISPDHVLEPLALLIQRKKRTGIAGPSIGSRRSGRAKEVGDRGELVVLEWLRSDATSESEREKIVWVASQGFTPGWDIEDRRANPAPIVYEVKATNGPRFPCLEVTANEWDAAQRLRNRYNLVLVSGCESKNPKLQVINDPLTLVEKGSLDITATLFRIERT